MKPPLDTQILRRRQFLRSLLRSTMLALGVATGGLSLWDRKGPSAKTVEEKLNPLPNYAIVERSAKLAMAHGMDRRRGIGQALDALGGMAAFVKPGERVLIKVNAAFATPPALCATTHPDAVTEVIRRCFEAGAGEVIVADNPINDPATCFELSGIGPAARQAGARVLLPHPDRFRNFSLPGGRLIQRWPLFDEPLRAADRVIGLSPVKDHHRSGASLGLKNWYGLLGGRRNIFHQEIHAIILELAMMIKPTLTILDGTLSMMRNGPTGGSLDDLKPTATVIAGTDPVAVDALGATLLEKSADDLPHLAMAQTKGLGVADYGQLHPIIVSGS